MTEGDSVPSSTLTADTRRSALAEMADPEGLDVLVIGGGVTGAGVALDAATRGLRVGIVEAQDWAAGTSSWSSKLVHGGLRYLQMLDFHLVHEALTERDLLIKHLAPHLVKRVPFLYPLEHRVWERAYVGAGIAKSNTQPVHSSLLADTYPVTVRGRIGAKESLGEIGPRRSRRTRRTAFRDGSRSVESDQRGPA